MSIYSPVAELSVDDGILGLIPLSLLSTEEIKAIRKDNLGTIIDKVGSFTFSRGDSHYYIGSSYLIEDPG